MPQTLLQFMHAEQIKARLNCADCNAAQNPVEPEADLGKKSSAASPFAQKKPNPFAKQPQPGMKSNPVDEDEENPQETGETGEDGDMEDAAKSQLRLAVEELEEAQSLYNIAKDNAAMKLAPHQTLIQNLSQRHGLQPGGMNHNPNPMQPGQPPDPNQQMGPGHMPPGNIPPHMMPPQNGAFGPSQRQPLGMPPQGMPPTMPGQPSAQNSPMTPAKKAGPPKPKAK